MDHKLSCMVTDQFRIKIDGFSFDFMQHPWVDVVMDLESSVALLFILVNSCIDLAVLWLLI